MRERKKAAMAPSSSSRREPAVNTCRLLQLPHSLIMDILSRLHINDLLLHCRLVCKRFLCFISDPEFAFLHLSRSPLCILIKTNPRHKVHRRVQLAQVPKQDFTPEFKVPTLDFLDMSACNGLVCLDGYQKGSDEFDSQYSFFFCNPALGEFITIRPTCSGCNFWRFGYSTVTNQYKVLLSYFTEEEESIRAEIYTIGTGTWRRIEYAPTDVDEYVWPFDAFLNGVLHWCNVSEMGNEFIHTFDFNTEKFGGISSADDLWVEDGGFSFTPRVGVLGGCLFEIFLGQNMINFNIWVMKEYGVKESWTKQFVIENLYPSMYDTWNLYLPMVVLRNGEILMLYNHEAIVCYNPETKQLRKANFQIRTKFDAIAYTPCSVSLRHVAKGEQISRCSTKFAPHLYARNLKI